MLLLKASGRTLVSYHTEKEKKKVYRGKRLGISTPDRIPLWEKHRQQQQEDARPGEADLDNLSGQQFSLQQSVEVGKEASPSTHSIPSYRKSTYTSWTPRARSVPKCTKMFQKNTLGTLTTETRRAIRTLQTPMRC